MKIGIIGGGIIGTTIAATLQKHVHEGFSLNITLIDDSHQRKHQTSQAGQGYLWSIHRSKDDLVQSLLAKRAWFDLLSIDQNLLQLSAHGTNKDKNYCSREEKMNEGRHLLDELFDPDQRGSLLIASTPEQKKLLLKHYETSALGKCGTREIQYFPSLLSTSCHFPWNIHYTKKLLRPGISALYYPHDYTCSPPHLMKYLLSHYNSVNLEKRTVTSLEEEQKRFDLVICCTGPWMKELCPEVRISPVRGILIMFDKQDENCDYDHSNHTDCPLPPMMEIGYGSMGYHFTLSSRKNSDYAVPNNKSDKSQNLHERQKTSWLLGASREYVDFDISPKKIEMVEKKLMEHAEQFILPNQVFGRDSSGIIDKRIGFRASIITTADDVVQNKSDEKIRYVVEKKDDNLILAYGFEGQGVLYAALAAKEVLSLVQNI